jgi:hypothetical protein
MYQSDLNRAIARATGESVSTINQLGFQLADPMAILDDDTDDRLPSIIDWDIVQAIQASKRHWSPTPCFAR